MRLLAALLLTSCLFLGGCIVKAMKLNNQARAYYDHSHYTEAQDILHESLEVDYEYAKTHYLLGLVYEAQGDLDNALHEYDLAIRFDPMLHEAYEAKIEALHRSGRYEQMRETAQKLLRRHTGKSNEVILIARTFVSKGLEEPAVMSYQRAQQLDPFSPEATVELADYYLTLGRQEPALAALRRAFEIDPVYPGLSSRLGKFGYKVEVPVNERVKDAPPPRPQPQL